MESDNTTTRTPYLGQYAWDVDKYQYNFPIEHWNLCKIFMVLNKTKYPETRLVQLTEAFFKKGVYNQNCDPKTDRIVAALSIPVVEHLLSYKPGYIHHPFSNKDYENPSGPTNKVVIPPASDKLSAKAVRENQSKSGTTRNATRGENLKTSKSIPSLQTKSTEQENQVSRKRVATDPEEVEQKRAFDQKTSQPKQTRTIPKRNPSSDKSNEYYKIFKALDIDSMKNLLIGFVVVRGVTKDSTLCNDKDVLEYSFKYSKFGPCSWIESKNNTNQGIVGVKLQWRDNVLAEAEGQNPEFVKTKLAGRALAALEEFSPVIKADEKYYNNGKCRELPPESPNGPCWHYTSIYTFNVLKGIINTFSSLKDYSEIIVLHFPEDASEFYMQDIIQFIENERADKLQYRLAEFYYQGYPHSAICFSYKHNTLDFYRWLDKRKDQRYSVRFKRTHEDEFKKRADIPIPKETADIANGDKIQGKPNTNNDVKTNVGARSNLHSSATNSLSNNQSVSSGSCLDTAKPKLPTALPSLNVNSTKNTRDGLSWMGKEHLSQLAKSIYLVKMIKEDSTTETNPFNLLRTTCSLAYNIDFKYIMKPCEGGSWKVLVVLVSEAGNILVGEATSTNCAEARQAASTDAVNTIQSCCRLVEPNFNYFAEGGVPTFISLRHPTKTRTYEIMNMDTNKNPLNEQVVGILLRMFVEDKGTEDIFFLASDFTNHERECIRKMTKEFDLGWRLFGMRDKSAAPGEVSNQHLCVFRLKRPVELVTQLIASGGSTDKYSIVTRVNTIIPQPESPPEEVPTTAQPKEVCDSESFLGGCIDPKCSLDHINILDYIVNKYLEIR
ncbi:uncharacterized protein LOC128995033 [Macrosteles quadrilineatus]|uniref:uncharacterized protein LOC128995033 n=1 Tax=Macrosteles quadrilineatus TaxID=74068 RepID=UPI0023E12633|nr:uncharacterized protein LOC128995033 [Macrosteles quadrilineatus]